MATARQHIRNNREPLSTPPKSPYSSKSKKEKSSLKDAIASSSETEGSDADEFEGFDQTDRSASHISPQHYPDLKKLNSPSHTSTPKTWNYSSNSLSDSFSPQKTDCEASFSESRIHHRRPGKPKTLLVANSRSQSTEERRLHRTNRGGPVILISMCILIIFSVIFLVGFLPRYFDTPPAHQKIKNLTEVYDEIKDEVRSIKKNLGQTRHLWTQILGQLMSLVGEPITQPSVIMAIVPKNSQKTAFCLIDSLSRMIKDAFDDDRFITFDVTSHLSSHKTLKSKLDDNLSGLSRAHAAVVYNIEKLPGDVAMMLHSYCDNENAPFKRAIFFLTLEVEMHYEEIDARKLDSFVNQLLKDSWMQSIREEDVAALVARVANAPIVVKPESEAIRNICDF